ncbi:MAG: HD domain-containing protein, partial [Vallitaleaceae bacterium]|nr:HD domain-containing protein [Vallitaleaceae bacterium]
MIINYVLEEMTNFNDLFDGFWNNSNQASSINNIICYIYSGYTDEIIYDYVLKKNVFSLKAVISKIHDYYVEALKNGQDMSEKLIIPLNELKIDAIDYTGLIVVCSLGMFTNVKKVSSIALMNITGSEKEFIDYYKNSLFKGYMKSVVSLIQGQINLYDKLYYTIDMFSDILSKKDRFMPFHMNNVANWCNKLALKLRLDKKQSVLLYIAALIHDIGKIEIDDAIINKPCKLTDKEYELVKNHSISGYKIAKAELAGMFYLDDVPDIILHHHERYDGHGYPSKLQGENIPYLSRILSVADTVDAMMSERSYKEQNSGLKVIKELEACAGTQFDANIVREMIAILSDDHSNPYMNVSTAASFIPNASIVFNIKKGERLLSYQGSIVVNTKAGEFIVHDMRRNEIGADLVGTSVWVGYFLSNIFVEYKARIKRIIGKQIILEDFIFLPLDIYSDHKWKETAYMYSNNREGVEAKIIKIGNTAMIFESIELLIDGLDLGNEAMDLPRVSFKLIIDGKEFHMNFNFRWISYYAFETKYVYHIALDNVFT